MKHLLLLWLLVVPGWADAINGGFETGTFSGWNVSVPNGVSEFAPFEQPAGTAEILQTFSFKELSGFRVSMSPVSGTYFAGIGTGNAWFISGQGQFDISASQVLYVPEGSVISGWSFFHNGDFEPQDSAWVKLFDASGRQVAVPWRENSGIEPDDGNSVPYQSATPWVNWQWQAPQTGNYTLALGVTTFGDNRFVSYGFHDAIQVPEPSSLLLLTLGAVAALFGRARAVLGGGSAGRSSR